MELIPYIDRGASCNSVCCHLMGSLKVNFVECTCRTSGSVYYHYQYRPLVLPLLLLQLLQLLQLPSLHLILPMPLPVLRNIFLWPCPFINTTTRSSRPLQPTGCSHWPVCVVSYDPVLGFGRVYLNSPNLAGLRQFIICVKIMHALTLTNEDCSF